MRFYTKAWEAEDKGVTAQDVEILSAEVDRLMALYTSYNILAHFDTIATTLEVTAEKFGRRPHSPLHT